MAGVAAGVGADTHCLARSRMATMSVAVVASSVHIRAHSPSVVFWWPVCIRHCRMQGMLLMLMEAAGVSNVLARFGNMCAFWRLRDFKGAGTA